MTQAQASFAWSRDDQLFLRFLLRSLQQHKSNQLDPYQVGRNTLMKAILPRGPEVTDSLIHELMIKLRTIAPWQDLHALSPVLNPTGDFETPFPLEAQGKAILSQSSSPKPIAGAVLGPLDLRPSDPLDSVRHDFGDLRVFVIDDPTAQELDDGVSVERIPSEPENHWVHIHVADPARILHPGHALCHLARKQFSSFYFGPANYPMFPKALMHDPKFGLSLTDSSMTEEPNRVLTFSIKLDGQANILDYKLRAGILRNVRKTSYQDVDLALGYSTPQKGYPFGGSDAINPGPPLNDSDVADLRILQKLADDQVLKRFRQGIFSPIQGNARVEWKTTPPINIRSPSLQGSVFQGFPEMEYVVSANDIEDCGSHNLVSEMMKLASRVASRVALDNNVPIIRRALDPSIFASEVDVDELLKLRTPHGYIAGKEFVKICAFSTSGRYTLLPKQHAHIGIPEGEGYSRATSPLRRYLDLVSHWQLHHILLGPNAPPRPPFGVDELEKLAVEAEIQEPLIRRMHKANDYFYALMYIKRFAADTAMGVERPFGDPLASVKAWTMQLPKKNPENKMDVKVYLPDLGIQAHMPDLPAELHDMPLGTNLQVKIKTIEMGLRRTRLVMDLAQDLSTIG
ncbi:hypothetical protein BDZ97DRAFT_1796568 [Flammula alnicola]|nr:hypothetical protein BDZ97DRAFT_1796568 [Flammula alnicola]